MAKSSKQATPTTIPEQSNLPLFFRDPHMLDSKRHAQATLAPTVNYAFTQQINSVPLNAFEFLEAVKSYPIVFTQAELPVPVAILGIEQVNLFMQKDGQWRAGHYIPAYIRQYPFIFMSQPQDEKLYLCIDEAAANYSAKAEKGAAPLYTDEGAASTLSSHALQFCTEYYQHRAATQAFCADLLKHDLLKTYQSDITKPDGKKVQLTGFQMIDESKFNALSTEIFSEFRQKGWLPLLYLAMASVSNWRRLLER